MKLWPAILVGFAIGLLSPAPAVAADLGDWSMKDAPGTMPLQARWYVRGDLGYAWHDDPEMIEDGIWVASEAEIDDTWTIGGGIGVYFSANLRGDVTVDYRNDAEVYGYFPDTFVGAGRREFDLSSTVVLANLYYDFYRDGRLSTYAGAGLGLVNHQTHDGVAVSDCGCTYTIAGETETDVAAAFMVGAVFDLAGERTYGSIKDGGDNNIATPEHRGLRLDLGYRFLYMGEAVTGPVLNAGGVPVSDDPILEDVQAHEFRIGLRYDIW
jgi:opacity protein-like surface antigen